MFQKPLDFDSSYSDQSYILSVGMFIGLIVAISIVFYIIQGIIFYKLAIKANHPSPVWSFIPILNVVQIIQISKLTLWMLLILCIPFVNGIAAIYIYVKFFQAYGKSGWLSLIMYIPIISYIYLWIMATDKNTQYIN
jgi:uncharacterized membrane protein YhaH (DUF805 family)